jgi:hypothetical protein
MSKSARVDVRFPQQFQPINSSWALELAREVDPTTKRNRLCSEKLRSGLLSGVRFVDVRNAWIEVPMGADNEWIAAYRIVVQGDRTVVGEIRIFPAEPADRRRGKRPAGLWSGEILGASANVPADGITARLIRDYLTVSTHTRGAAEWMRKMQWQYAGRCDRHRPPVYGPLGVCAQCGEPNKRSGMDVFASGPEGSAPRRPDVTRLQTTAKGKRRGRIPHPDWMYAEVAAAYAEACQRGSRHPVLDAKGACGIKDLSTARSRVQQAVERKFLTRSSGPGKVGGVLTPKGRRALRRSR